MAFSQFEKVVLDPERNPLPKGMVALRVEGPLELVDPERYEAPVVISFVLVHSAEGDRDPENAKRVRGVVEVADLKAERWDAVVDVVEADFAAPGSTRGIGVAVLEQKGRFAFETVTWCDHVELPFGTAQSEVGAAGAKTAG